jgi:glycosyltransferase involved in cell wall biosynthesis
VKKYNILYINHVSEMGGGEWSLLQLIEYIDRDRYNPVLLLQEPGPLSMKAKELGIESHFLRMRGWRKLNCVMANYCLTIPALKRIVRQFGIDLIHCNAYRLNPYAVNVAKSFGMPCVTHIRWFKEPAHIKKFQLDKADALIAVSKSMASFFNRVKSIETVYDGIDVSRFDLAGTDKAYKIRQEFGIGDCFLVGMVAQLTPRKGHKDFIEAAALIQERYPDVKFLIVGSDILEKQITIDDLRHYADTVGARNIIFTGQRDDDIEDIFKSLDCFVLPSHYEPLGRVVLEAMAAKVAVVATKSGGPEEIIVHGESGLLVNIKDLKDIAENVIKIIEDSVLRERMVDSAYQRVKERFSIDNYVKGVEGVYSKLLDDRGNR